MITCDIETTEKVEYEDLLKNYYEKMEIIEEQDKEIERLNKKIEQYENPEDMTLMFMWCDEKAKDEIKRLNNIIKGLDNTIENLEEVVEHKENIIKEVREYIENKLWNYFDERNIYLKVRDEFLEILDKENMK